MRIAFFQSISRIVVTAVGLACGWASAQTLVHSQSPIVEPQTIAIEELKRGYLLCNRAAMSGELNASAAMQCSVVYEQLKARAFGGDFAKLLAWSRANPTVRNPQP